MEQVQIFIGNLSPLNLTIGVASFAVLLSLNTMLRVRSLKRAIYQEQEKLEQRLRIITSGAVGMGKKLLHLETRLADAVNGHFQAAEAEAQFAYTQALKLVESGVEHSVVISNSGLSESEVNLIEVMHKARKGEQLTDAGS